MKILITGATGTLGRELILQLMGGSSHRINLPEPQTIRALGRDPHKLNDLIALFPDPAYKSIRPIICDIRDKDRLIDAIRGVDVVIHAAALKHIDLGQYNPYEFILTNVMGTLNVISACQETGVQKALFISSDKAVNPSSVYGSTKLIGEQAWILANLGQHPTLFSAVRYGNVLGSRGSVVEQWEKEVAGGKAITLTDPSMTRFWITIQDAARFVLGSIIRMKGREIFIPKLKSASVIQLALALHGTYPQATIERRPSEKMHELLTGPEEAEFLWDCGNYFMRDPLIDHRILPEAFKPMHAEPVPAGYTYGSIQTDHRLTLGEIREMSQT